MKGQPLNSKPYFLLGKLAGVGYISSHATPLRQFSAIFSNQPEIPACVPAAISATHSAAVGQIRES
jgi:hypothetical protein